MTTQSNQIMISFFVYSMGKGIIFKWNARSCFVEMLLCLAVLHHVKASFWKGQGVNLKWNWIFHPHCESGSHSEFILSHHTPGFMSTYYYLWFSSTAGEGQLWPLFFTWVNSSSHKNVCVILVCTLEHLRSIEEN